METPETHRAHDSCPTPRLPCRAGTPDAWGEGAQEREVAASAYYTMDGGRVSRPGSLQGTPGRVGDIKQESGSSRIVTRSRLCFQLSLCVCVCHSVLFLMVSAVLACLCRRLSACASHVGSHLSALGSVWLHCQASPLLIHVAAASVFLLCLWVPVCVGVSVTVSNHFSDFAGVLLSGLKQPL